MAWKAVTETAFWNWLQGLLPVPGGDYPVVDANIISGGGVPTQAEQRDLFAITPVLFSGVGLIAIDHTVVEASADVLVTVVFATKPTTQAPKELLTTSVVHSGVTSVDESIYPSDGILTTGTTAILTLSKQVYAGDHILVDFPGSDGIAWDAEIALEVPS